MSFLRRHILPLSALEKKVQRQDFNLAQTLEKGNKTLHLLKELEHFLIKNLGEPEGEKYFQSNFAKEIAFINSRISINDFDSAQKSIAEIKDKVYAYVESRSGAVFMPH